MSACVCCGGDVESRRPDPWDGRMDAYCFECSLTRCDAYPGACRQERGTPQPEAPAGSLLPSEATEREMETEFHGSDQEFLLWVATWLDRIDPIIQAVYAKTPSISEDDRRKILAWLDGNDVQERLRSIAAAVSSPVQATEPEERLAELAAMEDGWFDGEGKAPGAHSLAMARKLLAPHLFPTTEGGVQAEWTFGTWVVSLDFEPDGTVYPVAVDCSKPLAAVSVPPEAAEPLEPPCARCGHAYEDHHLAHVRLERRWMCSHNDCSCGDYLTPGDGVRISSAMPDAAVPPEAPKGEQET